MNAIRFSWMVLLAGVLIRQAVTAALPEGAQVVQAEEMTLNGSGWRVRDHDDQEWYAGRSYGQMLSG